MNKFVIESIETVYPSPSVSPLFFPLFFSLFFVLLGVGVEEKKVGAQTHSMEQVNYGGVMNYTVFFIG